MTREWVAIGTVLVLLASNFFGLIYSMLVLKTKIFKSFRIQSKSYESTVFRKRMPLFIFNFLILLSVAGFGSYLLYESLETAMQPFWLIGLQILFAFIIDDVWFYFFHRWLHENKYMLRMFILYTIEQLHHSHWNTFMPIHWSGCSA
jgi:sterol desaturase/sphingolipid hydroxylase (fatty acid hydroxylase superfamily)